VQAPKTTNPSRSVEIVDDIDGRGSESGESPGVRHDHERVHRQDLRHGLRERGGD
jgi:hypothetical protein